MSATSYTHKEPNLLPCLEGLSLMQRSAEGSLLISFCAEDTTESCTMASGWAVSASRHAVPSEKSGILNWPRPPVHTVQVKESNGQFRLPAKNCCHPLNIFLASEKQISHTSFSSLPLSARRVPESRHPAPPHLLERLKALTPGTENHLAQQLLHLQTCSLVPTSQ